jgi:hypothetical protein
LNEAQASKPVTTQENPAHPEPSNPAAQSNPTPQSNPGPQK